jgi:predicted metal-dependent hydrolase
MSQPGINGALRAFVGQLSLFGPSEAPSPPASTIITPESPPATPSTTHLQLGPRLVPYTLRRRARARLALVIVEGGLRINAPVSVPWREIERFAQQHREWVLRKLDEQAAQPRPTRVTIRDGTTLPLLGSSITVRVLPGHNRVRQIADTLLLEARTESALPSLARRGLQQRALAHFQSRLEHFAPLMHLAVPSLALSSARTRWGSCSALSGIRLNWHMIHLAPDLVDYVVVHELAHLHEMNHSPRFWAVVQTQYPHWRDARRALKDAAVNIPRF